MAKRRRLGAPQIEPKPSMPEAVAFSSAAATRRPPIAQVASDAAALAAAEKLAAEMQSARTEGRLVTMIPLDAIAESHILRDRIQTDDAEMTALKTSIAARGQQTPIEVVATGPGTYGLISGLRRLTALKALLAETGDACFSHAKALLKPLHSSPEAYLAMVEENEIRADLSFYERARIAYEAAEQGVFVSPQEAVRILYANTTPSRRSKIASFVSLHQILGSSLRFPTAIPEKLGLALVKAQAADKDFATRLCAALKQGTPSTPEAERRILDAALRGPAGKGKAVEIAPGITFESRKGRAILSGSGVTVDLIEDLREWLVGRR